MLLDGKHHGQGTFTHADGTVEEGTWKNDDFFRTLTELVRAEKKRIAKEKQEEFVRQERQER